MKDVNQSKAFELLRIERKKNIYLIYFFFILFCISTGLCVCVQNSVIYFHLTRFVLFYYIFFFRILFILTKRKKKTESKQFVSSFQTSTNYTFRMASSAENTTSEVRILCLLKKTICLVIHFRTMVQHLN